MNGTDKVEDFPLHALHQHPRQTDFFMAASPIEIQELASDLVQRGQQEPIHVCPDGTTLRGHRRVMAARLLGWKTIKAIVRQDLVEPCSSAAIAELINDNVIRQHLDDLALARCYRELKKSHVRSVDENESGDVRDRLAARLQTGKSGRSLDRLERLLQLPRDVQDMISSNVLNKHQGEKILRLAKPKQDALFADLRRKERVPDVLRRYGVIAPVTRKSVTDLGEELLRFICSNLKTMSRDIRALDRLQIRGRDIVDQLDEAARFLTAWSARKRSLKQKAVKSMTKSISSHQEPDNLSNKAR